MEAPLSPINFIKIEEGSFELEDESAETNNKTHKTGNKSVELNTQALSQMPKQTGEKYMSICNKFMEWRNANKITGFSEDVFLKYFRELSETSKPTTLYAHYSMLNASLTKTDQFDLKKYKKLCAFLKEKSVGFKSVACKALTLEEVNKFINEAPDKKHLATKVVLIMGIVGTCSPRELVNLKINDIKEYESSMILITLPKKCMSRSFSITDEFHKVVKKYIDLRPSDVRINRLFLNYQNGKCTSQPIGINKLRKMPYWIALFLNLPDPERYTGHTFRRTSAALLCNKGLLRRKRVRKQKVLDDYDYGDNEDNNDEDDDADGGDDNDDQIECYDDSDDDYEVPKKTKKRINVQIAQSSSLNQEDDTNLSIPSENISVDDDSENNDLDDPLSNERITEKNPSNHLEDPLSNDKVTEKSNKINTNHVIVEDTASNIKITQNDKEIICEQIEPNENTTVTEQNINLSSMVKKPFDNFNLTVTNCHNVHFNFFVN